MSGRWPSNGGMKSLQARFRFNLKYGQLTLHLLALKGLRRWNKPYVVLGIISQVKSVSYTQFFTYRTNTIVMIDADNNTTFFERTMKEPIDIENIQWKTNKFEFRIDS